MRDPYSTTGPLSPLVRWAVLFEAGVLGGGAVLAGWIVGMQPWNLIGWNTAGAVWGAIATAPMLAAYAVGVRLPIRAVQKLARFVRRLVRPLLLGVSWWELALVAASAGLGEELLFRGLIQNLLGQWLGELPALLIASLAFGLTHPLTRTYIIVAVFIGAYLGWLWLATGNLLVPILAHGLYDFIILMVFARQSRSP